MNIIDRAVIFVSRLTMLLILAGVAITFFEVVMRYLFNSPTTWAYKYTLWLGAIVYLVAGAYAMQKRRHIRITAIYKIAPAWLRTALDYVALFTIVIYTTLMLAGGSDQAASAFLQWSRSGRWYDPSLAGTIKPLILIMTVAVTIVAINNLLNDYSSTRNSGNSSDDADDASRSDKVVR